MSSDWLPLWQDFMSRALWEGSLVCGLVFVGAFLLRRRMSSQAAYALYFLALLQFAIPFERILPGGWLPWSPRLVWEYGASPSPVSEPIANPIERPRLVSTEAPAHDPWLIPQTMSLLDEAEARQRWLELRLQALREADARRALEARGGVPGSSLPLETSSRIPETTLSTAPIVEASSANLDPQTLFAVWLAVVLLLGARSVWRQRRAAHWLRQARPLSGWRLPLDYERFCLAMGLRRAIPIYASDRVATPVVSGFWRPIVVLPSGMERSLNAQELGWVLGHELAHVRRHDLWFSFLQRLFQILFFFHPAVWWVNHAIDREREYACDDEAIAWNDLTRQDCGQGFLFTVEWANRRAWRALPASLSALGGTSLQRNLIRKRLMRILDPQRQVQKGLSMGGLLLVLAVGVVTLPSVGAQEPQPPVAPKAPQEPAEVEVPAPPPVPATPAQPAVIAMPPRELSEPRAPRPPQEPVPPDFDSPPAEVVPPEMPQEPEEPAFLRKIPILSHQFKRYEAVQEPDSAPEAVPFLADIPTVGRLFDRYETAPEPPQPGPTPPTAWTPTPPQQDPQLEHRVQRLEEMVHRLAQQQDRMTEVLHEIMQRFEARAMQAPAHAPGPTGPARLDPALQEVEHHHLEMMHRIQQLESHKAELHTALAQQEAMLNQLEHERRQNPDSERAHDRYKVLQSEMNQLRSEVATLDAQLRDAEVELLHVQRMKNDMAVEFETRRAEEEADRRAQLDAEMAAHERDMSDLMEQMQNFAQQQAHLEQMRLECEMRMQDLQKQMQHARARYDRRRQ